MHPSSPSPMRLPPDVPRLRSHASTTALSSISLESFPMPPTTLPTRNKSTDALNKTSAVPRPFRINSFASSSSLSNSPRDPSFPPNTPLPPLPTAPSTPLSSNSPVSTPNNSFSTPNNSFSTSTNTSISTPNTSFSTSSPSQPQSQRATTTAPATTLRSRSSSTRLGPTGPIEEVTPWEVPVTNTPTRELILTTDANTQRARPLAVGPVGDVTPWETQDATPWEAYEPDPRKKVPNRMPSLQSFVSHSSRSSFPSSTQQHASTTIMSPYKQAYTSPHRHLTGPLEEVTPWEVDADQREVTEIGRRRLGSKDDILEPGRRRTFGSREDVRLREDVRPENLRVKGSREDMRSREDGRDRKESGARELGELKEELGESPGELHNAGRERTGSTQSFSMSVSNSHSAVSLPQTQSAASLSIQSSLQSPSAASLSIQSSLQSPSAASLPQSRPLAHSPSLASLAQSSVISFQSQASSGRRGLTGPVEEVTPWEVQDVTPWDIQDPPKGYSKHSLPSKNSISTQSINYPPSTNNYPPSQTTNYSSRNQHSPPPSSARTHTSGRTQTSTGRVEDVTPWEVQDVTPWEVQDVVPLPREAATLHRKGTVEDVTPWEVQPAPRKSSRASTTSNPRPLSVSSASNPLPPPPPPRKASTTSRPVSTSSHPVSTTSVPPSTTATGPVDEVLPWEMHPVPDIPVRHATLHSDVLPTTIQTSARPTMNQDASSPTRRPTQDPPRRLPPPLPQQQAQPQAQDTTQGSRAHPLVGPRRPSTADSGSPSSQFGGFVKGGGAELGARGGGGGSELSPSSGSGFPTKLSGKSPATPSLTSTFEDTARNDRVQERERGDTRSTVSSFKTGAGTSERGSPALKTGPAADVTPWELHPAPIVGKDGATIGSMPRHSMSMTVAQVEEIVPWELLPAPNGHATEKESTRTEGMRNRMQRHNSIGSRPSRLRALVNADTSMPPPPSSGSTSRFANGVSSTDIHSPSSPPSSPTRSFNNNNNKFTTPKSPKFSSTDSTSPKRGLQAREAQFRIKGVGHLTTGGVLSPGKRHHPYPARVVPYPRSYEREVLDLDVWETVSCQDMCESLTWHSFDTPPTRVLDIGCGTGTWIMSGARMWPETQFIGLDIVPLHPDNTPEVSSRVTWVQHNFLEGLPFSDREFDFVHVKRIALGVPEDKWDVLFEEIARVLKPGGAFEMIEEDLFFPGKPADLDETDSEEEDECEVEGEGKGLNGNGKPDESFTPVSASVDVGVGVGVGSVGQQKRDSMKGEETTITDTRRPSIPDGNLFFKSRIRRSSKPDARRPSTSDGSTKNGFMAAVAPHSRSAARPNLYVKTREGDGVEIVKESPSNGVFVRRRRASSSAHVSQSRVAPLEVNKSVVHVNSSTAEVKEDVDKAAGDSKTAMVDVNRSIVDVSKSTADPIKSTQNFPAGSKPAEVPAKPATKPFLLRSLPKPPINPRDHTILELIYNEMLAARFINTSPLSVVMTYMDFHLKDVRTHPPLVYMFPPLLFEPGTPAVKREEHDSVEILDARSARAAIIASLSRSTPDPSTSDTSTAEPEKSQPSSALGLLQHTSEYILLDDSRSHGFSPAAKATQGKATQAQKLSRLPNPKFHADVRTLNLHLSLRVKEIIGCSESMWEWVHEYQEKNFPKKEVDVQPPKGRNRAGSGEAPGRTVGAGANPDSATLNMKIIGNMTRDDFDHLLTYFDLDMQDQIAMGRTVEDRFGWTAFPEAPALDRKAFDSACWKWDTWLREKQALMQTTQPMKKSKKASRGTKRQEDSRATEPDNLVHFTNQLEPSSTYARTLPPARKMSRMLRVFVAWKP